MPNQNATPVCPNCQSDDIDRFLDHERNAYRAFLRCPVCGRTAWYEDEDDPSVAVDKAEELFFEGTANRNE